MPLVRRGPGLVGAAARTAVVAGTATAVSGRVRRRQEERYAAQDVQAYEAQAYEPAPAAAAAPAADEGGYAAEIEKLAHLRNEGILTEDEFQAKKKQLLGI
ncbi:MAG TPA: SHOCT domain-containing protein [Gaiellaceae bacterium]|nr:SHOCT domain-containing protein [Gaiellaceae bacterium]